MSSRLPVPGSTIRRHYKESLAQLGGFPERKKPVSVYPEIDLRARFLSYDKLNDEIVGYKLSLFNPTKYVKEQHKDNYRNPNIRPLQSGRSGEISHWHDEGELSEASRKLRERRLRSRWDAL